MQERELERGLLEHLRLLILELGKGFAFVGSQYHLEVGGQDYYLDLLFYHLRLRCFAVFELKIEEFKPEFAGKMNFYLSAVDDQLKHADDKPSIGIILCKGRNAVVVEYALRDTNKPMGVAEYRLTIEAIAKRGATETPCCSSNFRTARSISIRNWAMENSPNSPARSVRSESRHPEMWGGLIAISTQMDAGQAPFRGGHERGACCRYFLQGV